MRLLLFILFFMPAGILSAQTNISGIVNSYHKVVEVISTKACVRVDNTSGLTFNDLVLIIQMKGATVSTSNSSAFGSVSNMQNAGNYEISTICSIRGDSVFLFKQLVQSYTVSDKVQLVRIPQYSTAIVTDSLKAMSWDSTSGKGGVLAILASDDLILNAPLSANKAGYKGGAYVLSDNTCFNFFAANNYAYDPTNTTPQDGAYKGESVTSLPISQSGGKGAAANGGGGGNNHNNGGGGGANLSAGGLGGGNSSAAGCTVANAGRGGYALNSNSGAKFFMGGGGGAGHANSGVPTTGGGNGGGIIFIFANNLVSNGYKIMANGGDGGNTLGDGASGGGGGGTILLNVNNYADALNIEAKGGKGGDENDDFISQRCYAEGGGGSGGAVYLKTSTPGGIINVSGGVKGSRLNSLNCAAIVAGTNGTIGSVFPNYSYIQSSTLSSFCGGNALDVQLKSFMVKARGNDALISWQVDLNETVTMNLERKKEGGAWEKIYSMVPVSTIRDYKYDDLNLSPGNYHYRLQWIEMNGSKKYSAIRTVSIGNAAMTIFPNPASRMLTINYGFQKGKSLKIYNSIGEVVFQKKILKDENFIVIDVSGFSRGMYFAQIDGRRIRFLVNRD